LCRLQSTDWHHFNYTLQDRGKTLLRRLLLKNDNHQTLEQDYSDIKQKKTHFESYNNKKAKKISFILFSTEGVPAAFLIRSSIADSRHR
jgi:hypothetical protein